MPVLVSVIKPKPRQSSRCVELECILNHPDQKHPGNVKSSFWDTLSIILLAASLVMAAGFFHLYNHPESALNPFPPPTPAEVVLVPSITPSSIALPEIWTPLPTDTPDVLKETFEDLEPAVNAVTNTPVIIMPPENGKDIPTVTPPRSIGVMLPTKNPLVPTGVKEADKKILTITAPIGVFNNTWQNIQSIPSFSWSTSKSSQEIDHYLLYFGTKQNGKLSIKTSNLHFSHAAVTSGIYYFRLVAVSPKGKIVGSPSTFLFKYDDKPPAKPRNFKTDSPANTERPYFTWTESTDTHSGMIGGLAGYSIYQGQANKCGKPVAFTTVAHWTPVYPMKEGVTEYFCVRASDAIGNESDWEGPVAFTYAN